MSSGFIDVKSITRHTVENPRGGVKIKLRRIQKRVLDQVRVWDWDCESD